MKFLSLITFLLVSIGSMVQAGTVLAPGSNGQFHFSVLDGTTSSLPITEVKITITNNTQENFSKNSMVSIRSFLEVLQVIGARIFPGKDNGKLQFALPKSLKPGESVDVVIRVKGTMQQVAKLLEKFFPDQVEESMLALQQEETNVFASETSEASESQLSEIIESSKESAENYFRNLAEIARKFRGVKNSKTSQIEANEITKDSESDNVIDEEAYDYEFVVITDENNQSTVLVYATNKSGEPWNPGDILKLSKAFGLTGLFGPELAGETAEQYLLDLDQTVMPGEAYFFIIKANIIDFNGFSTSPLNLTHHVNKYIYRTLPDLMKQYSAISDNIYGYLKEYFEAFDFEFPEAPIRPLRVADFEVLEFPKPETSFFPQFKNLDSPSLGGGGGSSKKYEAEDLTGLDVRLFPFGETEEHLIRDLTDQEKYRSPGETQFFYNLADIKNGSYVIDVYVKNLSSEAWYQGSIFELPKEFIIQDISGANILVQPMIPGINPNSTYIEIPKEFSSSEMFSFRIESPNSIPSQFASSSWNDNLNPSSFDQSQDFSRTLNLESVSFNGAFFSGYISITNSSDQLMLAGTRVQFSFDADIRGITGAELINAFNRNYEIRTDLNIRPGETRKYKIYGTVEQSELSAKASGIVDFGNVKFFDSTVTPILPGTDLQQWKVQTPFGPDRKQKFLASGQEIEDLLYYDSVTGGLVMIAPTYGETTSATSFFTRMELRELLSYGYPTEYENQDNWVLSTAPDSLRRESGGVDGTMNVSLQVDRVTTTGEPGKIGRVVIGQIHATDNRPELDPKRGKEPIRLYYRKLPFREKGSIYFVYNPPVGEDQEIVLIGSSENKDSYDGPEDGIALGEKFDVTIATSGNTLQVSIIKGDGSVYSQFLDMTGSGFENEYLYFKAGSYNLNNTGHPNDYTQVTLYDIEANHNDPITGVGPNDYLVSGDGATFREIDGLSTDNQQVGELLVPEAAFDASGLAKLNIPDIEIISGANDFTKTSYGIDIRIDPSQLADPDNTVKFVIGIEPGSNLPFDSIQGF